ncbi:MAG TPA: hypothetical protein VF310_01165 [Vicinamibacteria bacterium]
MSSAPELLTQAPDDSAAAAASARASAWRTLAAVSLAAALTLVAADRALDRIAPVDQTLLQAQHGVEEFARGNPPVLVIGSSHARSFPAVRARLREKTGEPLPMAIVPEEGGTFAAYNWVLQNLLRPLIEETGPGGRPVRNRLREVMLITTYYDMCAEGDTTGVIAHGWTLGHFARDVRDHGITPQNRNYLRARWNELWSGSALVQDRGVGRIDTKIRWLLPGAAEHERRLAQKYRDQMEEQFATCNDPLQQRRLEESLGYLKERGLQTTVVLFPLHPGLVTERSKQTTLKQYSAYIAGLQPRYGMRVVDLTLGSPLRPEHFRKDLDHLTPEGNLRFAEWSLDHDLGYLIDEVRP